MDKDTKPRDVYALNLAAGQEIHLEVPIQRNQKLRFELAHPQSQSFQTGNVSLVFSAREGRSYPVTWSMNFAPLVTGIYYLAVTAESSAVAYTITVRLTVGA